MENRDLDKIKKYLKEIGMSEEEINKQLSNPDYAEIYMSQISAYEKAFYATDPNEIYSTPLDNFSKRGNNFTERKR